MSEKAVKISEKISLSKIKKYEDKTSFTMKILCPKSSADRLAVMIRHGIIADGISIMPVAMGVRTRSYNASQDNYGEDYQYATHPICTLPGLKENITTIEANISNLLIKYNDDFNQGVIHLSSNKSGQVYASSFTSNSNLEILNKDLLICTLDNNYEVNIVVVVSKNMGFVESKDQDIKPFVCMFNNNSDINIPFQSDNIFNIDSCHSISKNVNYNVQLLENEELLSMDVVLSNKSKPIEQLINDVFNYNINLLMEIAGYNEQSQDKEIEFINYTLIEKLNLNPSIEEILQSSGIETIDDITKLSIKELKAINGIDDAMLSQICGKLNNFGLKLKEN